MGINWKEHWLKTYKLTPGRLERFLDTHEKFLTYQNMVKRVLHKTVHKLFQCTTVLSSKLEKDNYNEPKPGVYYFIGSVTCDSVLLRSLKAKNVPQSLLDWLNNRIMQH